MNVNIAKPFAIQTYHNKVLGREELAVLNFCNQHNIPREYVNFEDIKKKGLWVTPVGSCKFCEALLNKPVSPDYYPKWLTEHLHRKVWLEEKWPGKVGIFIKPADSYKKFTGFITHGKWAGKKGSGPYWCSERVNFINEWRYYVANGEVLVSGWYAGNDHNATAPKLTMDIPKDYCGALDFGILDTGELALVEAQHPYAIGWYGDSSDNAKYVKFLVEGWKYMWKHYHAIEYQSVEIWPDGSWFGTPTVEEWLGLVPTKGLPKVIDIK